MNFEETVYAFLKELETFDCRLSCLDRLWDIYFPDRDGKWHYLHINKYRKVFYINCLTNDDESLDVEPGKSVKILAMMDHRSHSVDDYQADKWRSLISSARKWLRVVKKDWIKANKQVLMNYPLKYRYGIVPHSLIRASLPDIYRLDKELGKAGTTRFVRLLEDGYFMRTENTQVPSMSAADYFKYCRIAYIAGKRKDDKVDESLSGREMYIRYADGRHEGLLDIDENSEQEFGDWVDGKHTLRRGGGHPFEIKRGGNTTHIDLSVTRPYHSHKEGFKVELRGESIGRMVETIKMFLALKKSNLPITIANPENIRKRLLAQDNIGIVPSYTFLHRANQHFREDQDVFDVLHYDDLGRYKRRITPFITWDPLPVIKPNNG